MALEVKVTYQEDLIQQLNDVVIAQQRVIDGLGKRLAHLERGLLELAEGGRELPPSEKPPHY